MSVLDDLARSRFDIPLFAQLLGVQPHPGQKRFWKALIARNETRWRAENLTICLSAGNRAGKTLALAIAVLHHCVHKMGLRPPDPDNERELEAWVKAPYHWYHFGIQQEVGDLLWKEIVLLVEGRHPAQKGRGNPLIDQLGPIFVTEQKERGEYRWVQVDAIFGGAQVHFRTTSERALGSLGQEMNGISYDECGLDNNLFFVVNEVLHMRRLGTGGPLIMISTPSEGFTGFSDEWFKGDPLNPEKLPYRISLRMSTRDNIGFGIDQGMFDRLLLTFPEELIPQNIDGYFIAGRKAFFNHDSVDAAFQPSLHDEEPRNGEWYLHGADPAVAHDAIWSMVLRTEGRNALGVHVSRLKGKQRIGKVIQMIRDDNALFSSSGAHCTTGVDTTGFGGSIVKEMLSDIPYLRSIEFGGTKARKVELLMNLKGMLEQKRLRFPREGPWLELRRQLLAYRLDPVRGDKGQETDAVMALAICVRLLLQRGGEDAEDEVYFDYWAGAPDEVETGYWRRRPTKLDRWLAGRDNVTYSRLAVAPED